MSSKGVEFTVKPTKEEWGYYAMFKDPDGNEFWLFAE
jgi:predicted enzyme related to lactoylglutathione lyase